MATFPSRDFALGLVLGSGLVATAAYFQSKSSQKASVTSIPAAMTEKQDNPFREKIDEIQKFGFIKLSNVFGNDEVQTLRTLHAHYHERGLASMKTEEDDYEYVAHFEKETRRTTRCFESDGVYTIEICKGRLDISAEMPNIKKLVNASMISKLMGHLFTKRTNWNMQIGILTSAASSDHGPWHRDVVNICGEAASDGTYDDRLMVNAYLSPFYYTILIPLVDITNENGPTEFIVGSHYQTYDEIDQQKTHMESCLKAGSALVFDGRIFHRGRQNKSDDPRPVIYVVFSRTWYNDL